VLILSRHDSLYSFFNYWDQNNMGKLIIFLKIVQIAFFLTMELLEDLPKSAHIHEHTHTQTHTHTYTYTDIHTHTHTHTTFLHLILSQGYRPFCSQTLLILIPALSPQELQVHTCLPHACGVHQQGTCLFPLDTP